jgi:hypothetical protein
MKGRWIDASEKLPESNRDVLLVRKGSTTAQVGYFAAARGGGGTWQVYTVDDFGDARHAIEVRDVAYWMKFPEHTPDGVWVA